MAANNLQRQKQLPKFLPKEHVLGISYCYIFTENNNCVSMIDSTHGSDILSWFSFKQLLCTAKRILERFDRSVFLISKPISFFLAFIWLGFLSRNYLSSLDHDLMASIWEKAISILAGNLNSGRSYLISYYSCIHCLQWLWPSRAWPFMLW